MFGLLLSGYSLELTYGAYFCKPWCPFSLSSVLFVCFYCVLFPSGGVSGSPRPASNSFFSHRCPGTSGPPTSCWNLGFQIFTNMQFYAMPGLLASILWSVLCGDRDWIQVFLQPTLALYQLSCIHIPSPCVPPPFCLPVQPLSISVSSSLLVIFHQVCWFDNDLKFSFPNTVCNKREYCGVSRCGNTPSCMTPCSWKPVPDM